MPVYYPVNFLKFIMQGSGSAPPQSVSPSGSSLSRSGGGIPSSMSRAAQAPMAP
jgi:hypothetical protein